MTTPAASLLAVDGLSVAFRRRGRWLRAVNDVTFRVGAGEAYGLVGESGSGKSTIGLAALRYLPPNGRLDGGRVVFEGEDLFSLSDDALGRLRGRRVAAVYQNPAAALNPAMTVGRQIAEVYARHRDMNARESRDAAAAMLERVRVPRPKEAAGLYPHQVSGGMQQRAVIAMALAADPALLILDEPTTALDATVQAEVLTLFEDLRRDLKASLLLISHNLGVVRRLADRVGVLYAGEIVEEGESSDLLARPRHPYTRALVNCVPGFDAAKAERRLASIDGFPPDPANRPKGCLFEPRCPVRRPSCAEVHPDLVPASAGRPARCPFTDDAGTPAAEALPAPAAARAEAGPLLECVEVDRAFGRTAILKGVDLAIRPGETYGLVGESGSGKSTLARIVVGLLAPSGGAVRFDGADLASSVLRRPSAVRRALQMVFQSPDTTLNPTKRVGRILGRAVWRLGGLAGRARRERTGGLLKDVRLPDALARSRPANLSGGQRQRVAIARAFAGSPELVILDEPTSALDVSVQAAVLNLLVDLQRERNAAYLFISHDLAVVRYLADRVGVLYAGEIVESGPADRVFGGPCHPYTRALLASVPGMDGDDRPRGAVAATDPPAGGANGAEDAPPACVFADRCPHAFDRCRDETPPGLEDGPDHVIRCWLPLDRLAAERAPA